MDRWQMPSMDGRNLRILGVSVGVAAMVWAGGIESAAASWLGSARAPGSFRSWTVKTEDGSETTVSQVVIPLVASVRLGSQVDWVFSTAIANSEWDPNARPQASLSGNSDLKSQVFYRLLGDRLLLQAGVNLPIGAKAITNEELEIVQILGHPLLGFRVKHYGEGVNFSGGGALAFPLGEQATFAVGGGFVQRGEYEFLEGEPDFKPGTETSASAGLDFLTGDGEPFTRLDASYRVYGADESDGREIFQEGNQIEAQAHVSLRPGSLRADFLVRGVLKEDNEVLSGGGTDAEAVAVEAGTSLLARSTIGFAIGEATFFGVRGEVIRFDGSEVIQNDGQAWGVGPTFSQRLGSSGHLGISALYLQGKSDSDETFSELDLSGLDVSVQLTFRPTR